MDNRKLTSLDSLEVIAALASHQQGYLTRDQLLSHGLSSDQVQARVRSMRLFPVHSGVYSVAPWVSTSQGRRIAAVMAVGPGAVLSHQSAAALMGILPSRGQIHVLKPGLGSRSVRNCHPFPGPVDRIVVHRTRRLEADEVNRTYGIPATNFVRTTIDLAAAFSGEQMGKYLAEAERLRLLRLHDLTAELDRWRGKHGISMLRNVLRDWHPSTDEVMSDFEADYVAAMVAAGAPRPQVNPLLGDRLIDCLWEEFKLMIELDGTTYHADPATQVRDARRDREHTLKGYQVSRIKWPEFRDQPREMINQSLALLRHRGWTG